MPLAPEQLAIAMAILALAYFVKGVTSFGAALVCVPLMGLFMDDVRLFVPMLALLNFATNGVLLMRFWRDVELRSVGWLLAGAIVGIPFGSHLLATLPEETLRTFIGAVVVLSVPTIFWIRKLQPEGPPARRWAVLAGVLSGVFGGAVAIDGPPVVAYVAIAQRSKSTRYASLLAYFFIGALVRAGVYAQQGLLGMEGLTLSLWMLPAVGVGLLVGTRIYLRLDEGGFDRVMAAVLVVSGGALVARSLFG
jgi:hypothetical protein